jgi:hypothetical protein
MKQFAYSSVHARNRLQPHTLCNLFSSWNGKCCHCHFCFRLTPNKPVLVTSEAYQLWHLQSSISKLNWYYTELWNLNCWTCFAKSTLCLAVFFYFVKVILFPFLAVQVAYARQVQAEHVVLFFVWFLGLTRSAQMSVGVWFLYELPQACAGNNQMVICVEC